MATCHYCEDIVEKLNSEYAELYEENEKNKRNIADLERENASYRLQIEFCEIHTDTIVSTMEAGYDRDRKKLHDVLWRHRDVIVENRTWSWGEEGEDFDDDDPTHIPYAYCPEYLSAKAMIRLVRQSNRKLLLRGD